MLAKWIVCRVTKPNRPGFAEAQSRWSTIAGCDGFRGQFGGFAGDHAHIVGLWSDQAAYQQFMRHEHDLIAGRNRQSQFYSEIQVGLLSQAMDMPGQHATLADAVPFASFVRIADCTVAEARIDHFLEVQRAVWSPGMASAPGMLGGAFWSFDGQPNRFLVVSLWRSEAEHDAYATELLPRLRGLAVPEQDLVSIQGYHFGLQLPWSVNPHRPRRLLAMVQS